HENSIIIALTDLENDQLKEGTEEDDENGSIYATDEKNIYMKSRINKKSHFNENVNNNKNINNPMGSGKIINDMINNTGNSVNTSENSDNSDIHNNESINNNSNDNICEHDDRMAYLKKLRYEENSKDNFDENYANPNEDYGYDKKKDKYEKFVFQEKESGNSMGHDDIDNINNDDSENNIKLKEYLIKGIMSKKTNAENGSINQNKALALMDNILNIKNNDNNDSGLNFPLRKCYNDDRKEERPIDENSLNNNFNKIYCDNTNVNTINNNGTKDSNDNHRNNGENNNSNSNTSGNNNDTNDNNSNKNSGNSNASTCYYVNNYYDHQNYDKSYFNHPYVISHFNENTFNSNNDINSNNTHDAYNNILNTTFNHTNNNFDMNYNTNLPTHHIDDKKYLGIEANGLISTELDYDKKKYLLEHIEKLNFNLSENNISNYLENNLIENVNDQKNDDKNKKEKKKKKMDPNDINVNYQNDVAQTNMNTNELYNESGGIMKYVKNITNIFSSNKDKNDTNVDNQNDNTTNNTKKKNKGRNANKRGVED
ncbi:conserved Plasmodium protein, unknown function, partial [Plasmodium ovale curtisi]